MGHEARRRNAVKLYAMRQIIAGSVRSAKRISKFFSEYTMRPQFFAVWRAQPIGQQIYFATLAMCAGIFIACGSGATTTYVDSKGNPLSEEQVAAKKAEDRRQIDLEISAKSSGEKYCKKFLKYPLDSSFNWDTAVSHNSDWSLTSVTGTVQAPNSFGAKLTHEWGVIMQREGDSWKLLMCSIGNDTVYQDADAMAAAKGDRPTPSPPAVTPAATPDLASSSGSSAPGQAEADAAAARAAEIDRQRELAEEAERQEAQRVAEARRKEAAKAAAIEAAKTRIWKTADGQYEIEATFVTAIGNIVKLQHTDTQDVIEVPMEKLSLADQDFIKHRRWNEAE